MTVEADIAAWIHWIGTNNKRTTRWNLWFTSESFNCYCRYQNKYILGTVSKGFDIANITVRETGKGTFKAMIREYLALSHEPHWLRVENVETERFANGLLGMGFQEEPELNNFGHFGSFLLKVE